MTASEQARADAIADAETLRLYYHWMKEWEWKRAPAFRDADYLVACLLRQWTDSTDSLAVFESCSRGLARAAFRAVPGLRDDR